MRAARAALVLAAFVIAPAEAGCVQANRAALAVSTATLVCDWAQTRSAARAGWQHRDHDGVRWRTDEENPLLGYRPSTTRVDLYFAVAALANAALWATLPRKYKSAVPTVVTAVEIYAIALNLESTQNMDTGNAGVCGF